MKQDNPSVVLLLQQVSERFFRRQLDGAVERCQRATGLDRGEVLFLMKTIGIPRLQSVLDGAIREECPGVKKAAPKCAPQPRDIPRARRGFVRRDPELMEVLTRCSLWAYFPRESDLGGNVSSMH